MSVSRLHPADLEALADMTAERLASRLVALGTTPARAPQQPMLDPKALAKRLGVSAAYVYEHAVELGGIKLGTGPKARWRFDPATADHAICGSTPAPPPPPRSTRRRRSTQPSTTPSSNIPLLPIKRRER